MVHILIVEDDKAIREVFHMYLCLAHLGIECEDASKFSDAMAMVSKKKYDLIFLDLILNGEISTPLISHARRVHQDKPPKICIFSAMFGAQKIAEIEHTDFISKPFVLETIDQFIALNKN